VLGPLLAGAFFGDIPRALLGFPVDVIRRLYNWFTRSRLQLRGGDRADVHERGFEGNWDQAVQKISKIDDAGRPIQLSEQFLSLFYRSGEPLVPLWIANGTNVQDGARVLTAPFVIDQEWFSNTATWAPLSDENAGLSSQRSLNIDGPFYAVNDALALLQDDVRISTAINNTSRFPFLSPSGALSTELVLGARPDSSGIGLLDMWMLA
jgi:hypothetical protein